MTDLAPIHLVGLSGSLRASSFNTMLLRAAEHLLPPDAALTAIDLHDIPVYDEDIRPNGKGFTEPVLALRSAVANADAVLFVTPEYNHAPSGVIKNALDWLSISGDDNLKPLNWKWVAAIGASTGTFGPARGVESLKTAFASCNAYVVHQPQVLVNRAREKFSPTGDLTDAGARKFLEQLLANLVHLARTHKLADDLPFPG